MLLQLCLKCMLCLRLVFLCFVLLLCLLLVWAVYVIINCLLCLFSLCCFGNVNLFCFYFILFWCFKVACIVLTQLNRSASFVMLCDIFCVLPIVLFCFVDSFKFVRFIKFITLKFSEFVHRFYISNSYCFYLDKQVDVKFISLEK